MQVKNSTLIRLSRILQIIREVSNKYCLNNVAFLLLC